MQNTEKIVVAKPVASRPYSSFKSFSELLAGAIDASPPTSIAETTVAIRPKTMRFKPSLKRSPNEVVPSLSNVSESAACYMSDKALATTSKTDCKSTSIYKPMAKVVSKTTIALVANLGDDASHQQTLADEQAQFQDLNQAKYHFQNQITSSCHQNLPSLMAAKEMYEPSNFVPLNMEHDTKAQHQINSGDRPSYDGYNWRKYGQKQVKGSEYPRSYYKCTHPDCPMKKKVERSLDGLIAEIVYKGEHNHSKPRPPKRPSSGSEEQTFISDGHGRESNLLSCDPLIGGNVYDGTIENYSEVGLSGTYLRKVQCSHDSIVGTAYDHGDGTPDLSGVLSGEYEVGSKASGIDSDRPKCKRRKNKDQVSGAGSESQSVAEPLSMVQNSIESDVLGDGFRWRKYGQKVVKGNSYPRSYYRCTNLKCNIRKHVERASDDPRSFITTYEGKHNHDMPDKKVNPAASDSDALALEPKQ